MSVLYPQFLYGLIAIAIPVFIHLFNLRRHKTVYFSNTANLRAVQKKTKSTSQLRHLLTLLSRILFIIALTLAFAQPYFKGDETSLKSTGKKVSVFTDNSLSMDVPTPEGTPLSRAVQNTFAVLEDLNPRDEVQFLTHDFSGRDELLLNAVDVKAQVENIEVSPDSKTFSEIIELTELGLSKSDSADFYRFIISDFQKSFWDVERIVKPVPGKTILIPVTSAQNPNLAVDSLWFSSPVRYPDVKDSINIRLINTSPTESAKTKIELFLNGNLQSVISAELTPGITDTALYFNAKKTGAYHGEVRIEDAAASFDNRLFFTFQVPVSYRVVEITDEITKSASPVERVYQGDGFFHFKRQTPAEFDFANIRNLNLIVVNELQTATSGFWSELASFINDGGHVMFIPGDKNEELNNLFLNRLRVGSFSNPDTASGEVAEVEYEHELFRGVFESVPENALLPGYSRFFPFNSSGQSYLPVLKNKQGRSVLSELNPGNGKLYLWSVNLSNSEIAANTLWLPILYRAVFLSESQSALYHVIGKHSTVHIGSFEGKKSDVQVVSPGDQQRFKPEVFTVGNEVKIDVHGQIKTPGVYKVQNETGDLLSYVAFNFSSAESYFEFAQEDELRAGLQGADFESYELSLIHI